MTEDWQKKELNEIINKRPSMYLVHFLFLDRLTGLMNHVTWSLN